MKRVFLNSLLLITAANGKFRAPLTADLAFIGFGIFSQPATVQFKQADLEFFAVPEKTIPKGGWIELRAPDEINVYTNAGTTCMEVIQ